jgi:hypothetical protein
LSATRLRSGLAAARLLLLHRLTLRHAFLQKTLGNGCQQAIGFHFLTQGLLQELGSFTHAELLGEHAGALVAGHFVVLDLAAGADEAGIEDDLLVVVLHDLLSLLYDAFHAMAGAALGAHIHRLKDLFEPLHLALGHFQMLAERILEFLVGGRFGHPGKRSDELFLRIEQILEFFHQQLLQTFHFLCHEILPSGRFRARSYECRNSTE